MLSLTQVRSAMEFRSWFKLTVFAKFRPRLREILGKTCHFEVINIYRKENLFCFEHKHALPRWNLLPPALAEGIFAVFLPIIPGFRVTVKGEFEFANWPIHVTPVLWPLVRGQ